MRRLSVTLLALALTAVLSSCAAAPEPPQPRALAGTGVTFHAGTKISPAQAKQLEQSSISYDDYKTAYRRYAACLAAKGYTLMDNGESNKVLQFGVPDAAVVSGVDDECLNFEFEWIATIWEFGRADYSSQAKAYAVCLEKAGIKPKAKESDKYDQLVRANIDTDECYNSQYPRGDN